MAKNNSKKKNAKKLATQILVFALAALFIVTSFISVIPALFA